MEFCYHASPVAGITTLEPRVSNHGVPRVYFSQKRENTLVYLCNAVEKYCRETGFPHDGIYQKWGPYGFTRDGLLQLEEYYPDALRDTYAGVSAYLYRVCKTPDLQELPGIRDSFFSDVPVPVCGCEFIEDAYQAIMDANRRGLIALCRYEDTSPKWRAWNESTIRQEYRQAEEHPEYRHFLRGKFGDIF